MLVSFKPVRVSFGKDLLTEEGHFVENVHSGFRVANGQVYNAVNEEQDNISLCFSVQFNHSALIRTGPIDTFNKAKQFFALALDQHKILAAHNQKLNSKPRIVCDQLDDPLFDWEQIQIQHVYLTMAAHEAKMDLRMVHMSLATDYFFVRTDVEPRSPFKKKNADKMAKELNWIGWVKYALWISEEMDVLLSTFRTEASQTYQLEAFFRDFIQESRSHLLDKAIKDIHELSLKYAQMHLKKIVYVNDHQRPDEIHKMNQEMASLGKNIFKVSMNLKESLDRIFEIVLKIEAEAVRNKKIREEYVPLRRMILLFRKILQSQIDSKNTIQTSWSQQVMLRQLLNDELMVVSSVNCASGLEQTHQSFTLQVAIMELKQKYPADRVMDMVFNWLSTNSKLNMLICEYGYVKYHEWLQNNDVVEDQINFHKRAILVHKLRAIFFRTLMDLCLPIQQICGIEPKAVESNLKAEKSYLNLLPSFLEMKYEDGEVEWTPYVTYDAKTGESVDLVDKGYRTLSRFRE